MDILRHNGNILRHNGVPIFKSSSVSPSYPTDGLIIRWTLDNTYINSAPDTIGSYDQAVDIGDPSFETGGPNGGYCLYLDGNDQCEMDDNAPSAVGYSGLSWSMWVKSSSTATLRAGHKINSPSQANPIIFTATACYIKTNNFYAVSISTDNFNEANTWFHICAVYNKTNIILYVDGQPYGSPVNTTANLASGTGPYRLGGMDGSYFNGYLGYIYIYNRGLSSSEVSQLYNNGTAI